MLRDQRPRPAINMADVIDDDDGGVDFGRYELKAQGFHSVDNGAEVRSTRHSGHSVLESSRLTNPLPESSPAFPSLHPNRHDSIATHG